MKQTQIFFTMMSVFVTGYYLKLQMEDLKEKMEKLYFQNQRQMSNIRNHPEQFQFKCCNSTIASGKIISCAGICGWSGELAYSAEIKPAFELLDMRMPPIWPRLSFTLLERSVETDLNDLGFLSRGVNNGVVEQEKMHFLEGLKDQQLETMYENLLNTTMTLHQIWGRSSG